MILLLLDPVAQPALAQASVELQLPLTGSVSVIGNLHGEGDHVGRDEWAADLVSDVLTVAPAAPGMIAFAGWDCQRVDPSVQHTCYGYTVVVAHAEPGLYSIYTHLACDENLPGAADGDFCSHTRDQTTSAIDELTSVKGEPISTDTPLGTLSNSGCLDQAGIDQCGGAHLHFAVHLGTPDLQGGARLLFDSSLTSVNIWSPADPHYMTGLPWPQAHGAINNTPTETPVPITAHVRAAPPLAGWQEFQSRVGYSLWLPPDWGVASCDEVGDACGSGSWRQGSCVGEIGPGVTARQDRAISSIRVHRLPITGSLTLDRLVSDGNLTQRVRGDPVVQDAVVSGWPARVVVYSTRVIPQDPSPRVSRSALLAGYFLTDDSAYTVGLSIATAPCSNLSPDSLLDQGQSVLRDILASFQT